MNSAFYDFVIDSQVRARDSSVGRENVMNFLILESFAGRREKYLNEIYSIWCLPAFQLNLKRLFKTSIEWSSSHGNFLFLLLQFKIPMKFFCFNTIFSLHFESITIKKKFNWIEIFYIFRHFLKIENISR